MAVEGENNNGDNGSGIPAFDPSSFLEQDNNVGIGVSMNRAPEGKKPAGDDQNQNQGGDGDEPGDGGGGAEPPRVLSFEDDFLSYEEQAPAGEEAEVEFNAEDYAALGKTLGVEINSKEDLENVQAKFKKEPAEIKKNSNNFSSEEQTNFTRLEEALTAAQSSTPEQIMKWHLKRVNTSANYEENPEELDYHIESLKETGMFDSQVNGIKEKLISDITAQKDDLVSEADVRTTNTSNAVNKELEQELKNYKEGFHGINLKPKDLLDTFNSIRDGSVFTEIESKQANVAEMALLWKNKELFYKAFENPDTSTGVGKMMDDLQNSRAKPAAGNKTLKNPHVFDPAAFLSSEEISQKTSSQ